MSRGIDEFRQGWKMGLDSVHSRIYAGLQIEYLERDLKKLDCLREDETKWVDNHLISHRVVKSDLRRPGINALRGVDNGHTWLWSQVMKQTETW